MAKVMLDENIRLGFVSYLIFIFLILHQQTLPIEASEVIVHCKTPNSIITISSDKFSKVTLMLQFREKECQQIVNLVKQHGMKKVGLFLTSIFHMKQLLDVYSKCKKKWRFTTRCRNMIINSPAGIKTIENFHRFVKLR